MLMFHVPWILVCFWMREWELVSFTNLQKFQGNILGRFIELSCKNTSPICFCFQDGSIGRVFFSSGKFGVSHKLTAPT